MLKKYENFFKLSKTKQCSFYEANAREDMNKVILKKLRSNWTWNQMLKSHALKLQSAETFTPKILQIFKHNGSYFVVYEKLHGSSLKCSEKSLKLQLDDFYSICNELVDILEKLKQEIYNLYIYPEWIFLHRNGIKICHFEPYFQQKRDKKDEQNHVFIYDMLNGNLNSKKLRESQQSKSKRIKNLNFNLGYIAYHVLTGLTTEWKEDEQDYESKIKDIQTNAQARILNEVSDKVLASFVAKLLNCTDQQNTFDDVTQQNDLFDEFKSYLKRKKVECRCCKAKRESFRIVEFSLEKIKLQKKIPKIKTEKKKKCFRPCCKTFEDDIQPEAEEHQDNKYVVVQKTEPSQKVAIKRIETKKTEKLRTQNSPSPTQTKLKQRTFSNLKTVTRYKMDSSLLLPSLGTERRSSTVFSKTKPSRSRQITFKKSMDSHIANTYLKTEY